MKIRKFKKQDTREVALLARNTFRKYNGSDFFSKDGIQETSDFFDPDKNTKQELQEKFAETPIFYVAEQNNKIIGMVRGLPDRIKSLFVDGKQHRKGVGRKLIQQFEQEAKEKKSEYIKVRSSLFAISFYQRMGYKKTTGIRNFTGLKVYNAKKELK